MPEGEPDELGVRDAALDAEAHTDMRADAEAAALAVAQGVPEAVRASLRLAEGDPEVESDTVAPPLPDTGGEKDSVELGPDDPEALPEGEGVTEPLRVALPPVTEGEALTEGEGVSVVETEVDPEARALPLCAPERVATDAEGVDVPPGRVSDGEGVGEGEIEGEVEAREEAVALTVPQGEPDPEGERVAAPDAEPLRVPLVDGEKERLPPGDADAEGECELDGEAAPVREADGEPLPPAREGVGPPVPEGVEEGDALLEPPSPEVEAVWDVEAQYDADAVPGSAVTENRVAPPVREGVVEPVPEREGDEELDGQGEGFGEADPDVEREGEALVEGLTVPHELWPGERVSVTDAVAEWDGDGESVAEEEGEGAPEKEGLTDVVREGEGVSVGEPPLGDAVTARQRVGERVPEAVGGLDAASRVALALAEPERLAEEHCDPERLCDGEGDDDGEGEGRGDAQGDGEVEPEPEDEPEPDAQPLAVAVQVRKPELVALEVRDRALRVPVVVPVGVAVRDRKVLEAEAVPVDEAVPVVLPEVVTLRVEVAVPVEVTVPLALLVALRLPAVDVAVPVVLPEVVTLRVEVVVQVEVTVPVALLVALRLPVAHTLSLRDCEGLLEKVGDAVEQGDPLRVDEEKGVGVDCKRRPRGKYAGGGGRAGSEDAVPAANAGKGGGCAPTSWPRGRGKAALKGASTSARLRKSRRCIINPVGWRSWTCPLEKIFFGL